MEKIQSALAKARAARHGKTVDPDSALSGPGRKLREGSTVDRTDDASPAVPPDVAAAWLALSPLTLKPKTIAQNRIVALQDGRDRTSIDMMRTRVLQQMRDNDWRRLAITSPTAGCGKSTIATSLAFSLQRLPDKRTLLLELDLRRPSLKKMLGIDSPLNFSRVLEGSEAFSENALAYGANLAVAASERPSHDSTELLSGHNIPEVLEDIERTYAPDVMIFDMPPMLANDDVMAFARHVDCVLLVAGAEATTIKEIDICEQDLASQTNVMGVILNKCRYLGPEHSYSYYE
ncbi:CpsD/CapB family tyrosine-protein kinase [Rhodobacteraceae bacterium KMM 6894]|nr:CpsD/CapB family tyrosine-protein kinase [Rhodobacteraceae bacterium KMM 6894]